MQKLLGCKKYFFSNLISLLGYFTFLIFLISLFIWTPDALQYGEDNLDPDISYAGVILFMYFYSLVYFLLSFILVILSVIEHFLRKNNKWFQIKGVDIPDWLIKIHSIAFWLGISFVPVPIFVFLYLILK